MFKSSKPWFIFCVLFILLYFFFFKKKGFSFYSSAKKNFYIKRLIAYGIDVKLFPDWLIHNASEDASKNSILEFIKDEFSFLNKKLLLIDSIKLFKAKVSNGNLIY